MSNTLPANPALTASPVKVVRSHVRCTCRQPATQYLTSSVTGYSYFACDEHARCGEPELIGREAAFFGWTRERTEALLALAIAKAVA